MPFSLGGLLNNVFNINGSIQSFTQRIADEPNVIKENITTRLASLSADATNPYAPPSLANPENFLPLNGGIDGYIVLKDTEITATTRLGNSNLDGSVTKLKAGSYLKRANTNWVSGVQPSLFQSRFEFVAANAGLADSSGDGILDGFPFQAENGKDYIVATTPGHLFEALGKAPGDVANTSHLPDILVGGRAGKYAYSTKEGEWIVVNKQYRTDNGLNPNGILPFTGYALFGNFTQQQFGQTQFGLLNSTSVHNPLQFDPYNEFQQEFDRQNIGASYRTPVTVTHAKLVNADSTNAQLDDLRKRLADGPRDLYWQPLRTFQNGILTGVPNYPVPTIDLKDDQGNVIETKTIQNAYLNRLGELVVEYA